MTTPIEICRAERSYQRAMRRVEEARERRDDVVRAAREEGWTLADLARETGLSYQRAQQIVKRTR